MPLATPHPPPHHITVVGSKLALKFIEDQIHIPFNRLEVKSGEFLNLGTNNSGGTKIFSVTRVIFGKAKTLVMAIKLVTKM